MKRVANCADGEMAKNPVVVMETSMGTVKMELWPDKAPLKVANFLAYVDANSMTRRFSIA
jgi:peptidyl-prolyl cis-trans isomerase A (cyclophilin A)